MENPSAHLAMPGLEVLFICPTDFFLSGTEEQLFGHYAT